LPIAKFSGPFESSLAAVSDLEDVCGFREKRSLALPVRFWSSVSYLSLLKWLSSYDEDFGIEGPSDERNRRRWNRQRTAGRQL